MTNLLEETLAEIHDAGLTPEQITFIGSRSGSHGCTWEEFKSIANVEYNDGYGGQEVAVDLVIVFNDGSWLSRGEYDGSEWWDYNKTPRQPSQYKPITRVVRESYESSVAQMNP